jgi:CheY-like chemotaxis protein
MVSPTGRVNVAPPSVDASTISGAENVVDRRNATVIRAGARPAKVTGAVVTAWPSVQFVKRRQCGAERGVLELTTASFSPGNLTRLEDQPTGRTALESKDSTAITRAGSCSASGNPAAARNTISREITVVDRLFPFTTRAGGGFTTRAHRGGRGVAFCRPIPYIRLMSQKRILYVDDEQALRDIVREQLVEKGFAVEVAEDGDAAVTLLERHAFDVAILDIKMPGKSGLEVLRFIRDNAFRCRVIMLTGMAGFTVGTESFKLGADAYITKPFNMEYLLMKIDEALAKEV